MSDALIEAFWARFTASAPAGEPHGGRGSIATRTPLPTVFERWLTARCALRIAHPAMTVSSGELARFGGDWLALALARHRAMRALADAYDNPSLARLVPFAEGAGSLVSVIEGGARAVLDARGCEVALALDGAAIVLLDPARYEEGPDAVRARLAHDTTSFLRALVDEAVQGAARGEPAEMLRPRGAHS